MDTSVAAAEIAVDGLTEKQSKVLFVLRAHPAGLTDEALTSICRRTFGWGNGSTARTRRGELVDLGKVVDTGDRRKITSGRQAAVWKAL